MASFSRYLDGLVQSFEDSRDAISDQNLLSREGAEHYFTELYEREAPRLMETIREQEPHLSETALEGLKKEVDTHLRKILIPAYARLAVKYTPRERNDFYRMPENLHGLERVGWGLTGILIGAFVIWAPFIPLWSKEWIIPFMIMGLIYPNIRRYFATLGYEKQINGLVENATRAFERMDKLYLEQGEAIPELEELSDVENEEELLRRNRLRASQTDREH